MTGVPTRHQTLTQTEDLQCGLASWSTNWCHLLRLHCQHHPWAIVKLKWHHAISGALKQHRWHLSSLKFHERLDGEHPECSHLVTQGHRMGPWDTVCDAAAVQVICETSAVGRQPKLTVLRLGKGVPNTEIRSRVAKASWALFTWVWLEVPQNVIS